MTSRVDPPWDDTHGHPCHPAAPDRLTAMSETRRRHQGRVPDVLPGIRKDLEDLVRIESVSADPERARRGAAQRRGGARAVRGRGLRRRRDHQRRRRRPGGHRAQAGPARARRRCCSTPTTTSSPRTTTPTGTPRRSSRPSATAGSTRRGAADDKAGIAAHLGALRVHGDDLPVNVVMFVEGEEEVGSDTLPALLRRAPRRPRAPTSS